jgi:hypothetical protein
MIWSLKVSCEELEMKRFTCMEGVKCHVKEMKYRIAHDWEFEMLM